MQAIVVTDFGSPSAVRSMEFPSPQPGPGQVLVKMHYAALNFPDLLLIEGKYQLKPELPFVPGREGAGLVTGIGEGVTGLKVGQRVMVQTEIGTLAEQAVAEAKWCYPVPDGIEVPVAAAMGVAYQTAFLALHERAALKSGETVLVAGASGSVGLAAIELAKAHGATVIAGLTTPEKKQVARNAGADHCVSLAGDDLKERLREDVNQRTGGADVVIDCVGGNVFAASLRTLNWCGRLVVVGFASGTIPTLKANYPLLKNIAVAGVNYTGYRHREPDKIGRIQKMLFQLVLERKLKVPIQAVFAAEDFQKAVELFEQREIQGKVLIKFLDSG